MSELESFVLDYLEEVGSLVEPPAFRVYEVLLPEKVAERWQTPPYLQLAFTDTDRDDTTYLGYNHPLVEQMVQEAHGRSASTRLFINDLRLDKTDVDDLAIANWVILNARAERQKWATTVRVRHTYIRFNFKAALLSDDKQERLVSVLMDAHGGHRIANAAAIDSRATAVTPDATLNSLPDGPIHWQPKNSPPLTNPLDDKTLTALLDRAQTAVLQEMQTDLNALQSRSARFRQLDEARLTDYYDTLEKDLQTRLKSASPDRRPGLEDKLTAVQTERTHKLADLTERYQLRVNLTLLNLLVIQQAKLIHSVQIANRTTQISIHAVWDPLLRQIEPLLCHACGQPGQRMYLCHNGHLAHETCLAPACIDCKRVFCQECADDVGVCDVCQQPLCRHSRIVCPVCGRFTCQAHRGLCHSDNGRPATLTTPAAAPPQPEPPPTPKTTPKPTPKTPSKTTPKPTPKPPIFPTERPSGKPAKPILPPGTPKPLNVQVVIRYDAIAAFILAKRERQIAIRVWELNPDEGGILRICNCEKGDACPANNMILLPADSANIEKQLLREINVFAAEYGLPENKISFNRTSTLNNLPYPVPRFDLFGLWKNEKILAEARAAFHRLR